MVPAELGVLLVEAICVLRGLHGIGSRNMVLLAGLFTWIVTGIYGPVVAMDSGGINDYGVYSRKDMTPIAAQYRAILEENGWTLLGECRVCSGTKWHYAYGNVVKSKSDGTKVYEFEIKTNKDADRFTFFIKGHPARTPMRIKGLVELLQQYGAVRKEPA